MNRGSRTDSILTLVFMTLAVAAVVCYFAVTDHTAFLVCSGLAVVLRLLQYAMRFIH